MPRLLASVPARRAPRGGDERRLVLVIVLIVTALALFWAPAMAVLSDAAGLRSKSVAR
jgi:hypothetical protein